MLKQTVLKQTMTAVATGLVTAGLLVAFGFTAVSSGPAAVAKEKKSAAEVKKERWAKLKKKYETEKGGKLFFDHKYWLDVKKLDDARWRLTVGGTTPPTTEASGYMLTGSWISPNLKGEAAITARIQKYRSFVMNGGRKQPFTFEFKYIGEAPRMSDSKKIHDAFHRDWLARSDDVIDKETVKQKKKKIGPSVYYAAGTATDSELKDKVRREFYLWTGDPSEVYIGTITYHKSLLGQDKLLAKGMDFMKAIKEIKDK